ncbi:hypothetical protein CBL_00196 [Carabus blaptoides fortunei]
MAKQGWTIGARPTEEDSSPGCLERVYFLLVRVVGLADNTNTRLDKPTTKHALAPGRTEIIDDIANDSIRYKVHRRRTCALPLTYHSMPRVPWYYAVLWPVPTGNHLRDRPGLNDSTLNGVAFPFLSGPCNAVRCTKCASRLIRLNLVALRRVARLAMHAAQWQSSEVGMRKGLLRTRDKHPTDDDDVLPLAPCVPYLLCSDSSLMHILQATIAQACLIRFYKVCSHGLELNLMKLQSINHPGHCFKLQPSDILIRLRTRSGAYAITASDRAFPVALMLCRRG